MIKYDASGPLPSYGGLYFNPTNRFLYVAPGTLTVIHVFI